MSKPWALAKPKQCAKCPWKVSTDPNAIPNGYDPKKHRALKCTIAKPADTRGILGDELRMMACHETPKSKEQPCIGWLMHQLGPGNNIGLRLHAMSCTNMREAKLDGPQHKTFEDTLP